MTSITWPDTLPLPKLTGLTSSPNKAFIRTDMDAGPAKQRQRYTAVPKNYSGIITVTDTQRSAFESFFIENLGNGTLRFAMKNPQTLVVEEFRFTDKYSEVSAQGLWDISLPLERLP